MKVSRRTFIKYAGASAAGAALLPALSRAASSIALPSPREVNPPEGELAPPPAGERWVPSLCLQCDAACGIKVKVIQGRAVKIEGHPLFPTNQGGLCPKGQAGLQVLYDPDRIRGPLKRVGERGSGRWEQITWTEALKMVAERLRELREKGNPTP